MKEMHHKQKSSKFYYIVGVIIVLISLCIIITSITLPVALKEEFSANSWAGWVCLVTAAIGLLFFLLGYFFLKKGNYVRLNKHLEKQNKEFLEKNKKD